MSDFDGAPQRDDRHHRPSRSRSPISPGCAGETLAKRKEQRLTEAACADRAAGWAAQGSLHRHRAVDPGACASRGDRPRRPGCKPCRPDSGGGPRSTGG